MKLFTVGPVEMFDEVKAIRADKDSVPYFRTKEFPERPNTIYPGSWYLRRAIYFPADDRQNRFGAASAEYSRCS